MVRLSPARTGAHRREVADLVDPRAAHRACIAQETVDQEAHVEAHRVQARREQAAHDGVLGAAVKMHRLRIELRRERLDGVGGDEHRSGFEHLADGEILVAANHVSARSRISQVAKLKCMTSPSATT